MECITTQNLYTNNDFKVIFSINSKSFKIIECNSEDKIKIIFQKFADDISASLNSLIFLYSGKQVTDLNKKIKDLANPYDIQRKELNILSYNIKDDDETQSSLINDKFKVIFSLEANQTNIIEGREQDIIRDICNEFSKIIGADINSLYFSYDGHTFNLDDKIGELAISLDKKFRGLTVLVYEKNDMTKKLLNQINAHQFQVDSFRELKINEKRNIDGNSFLDNNQRYQKNFLIYLRRNIKKIILISIGIIIAIAFLSCLIIYFDSIKNNKKKTT